MHIKLSTRLRWGWYKGHLTEMWWGPWSAFTNKRASLTWRWAQFARLWRAPIEAITGPSVEIFGDKLSIKVMAGYLVFMGFGPASKWD